MYKYIITVHYIKVEMRLYMILLAIICLRKSGLIQLNTGLVFMLVCPLLVCTLDAMDCSVIVVFSFHSHTFFYFI